MSPARTALCAALLLAACAAPEEDPAGIASSVSELGLVSDVTREQVHEAARTVLDPSRATVVVAGPYSGSLQ